MRDEQGNIVNDLMFQLVPGTDTLVPIYPNEYDERLEPHLQSTLDQLGIVPLPGVPQEELENALNQLGTVATTQKSGSPETEIHNAFGRAGLTAIPDDPNYSAQDAAGHTALVNSVDERLRARNELQGATISGGASRDLVANLQETERSREASKQYIEPYGDTGAAAYSGPLIRENVGNTTQDDRLNVREGRSRYGESALVDDNERNFELRQGSVRKDASNYHEFDGTPIKWEQDLSAIGVNIRNMGRNHDDRIAKYRAVDYATDEELVPLAKRTNINQHYRTSTQDVDDGSGDIDVTVEPIGAVANGRRVGNRERRQRRVKRRRQQRAVDSGIDYLQQFPNLSGRDRAYKGFETFFDLINPFFDGDERFNFEIGGNKVDGLNLIQEGFDTFNIYANWANTSDLRRFTNTASQLQQTAEILGYGEYIPRDIVGTGVFGLNFGYSAYKLLDDWNDLSAEQRVVGTINTIQSGIQAYHSGAALYTWLTSAAATATGATAGTTAGLLGGSVLVGGDGELGTGESAGTNTGGDGGGDGGGGDGNTGEGVDYGQLLSITAALYGSYQIIDQWGQGGTAEGRASGAASGAAVGQVFGEYGAIIGAVIGAGIGSINAQKSLKQKNRDVFRHHYSTTGLFEETETGTYELQLADGSVVDVGEDGRGARAQYQGAQKQIYDPSRVRERDKESMNDGLRPYDIDYTSDLDYHTSLATKGINVLLNGGSNYSRVEANQMNGLLTNAAVSNIESREFNEENFAKSMENVRSFYKKLGIESKEALLHYLDISRAQKRISVDDYNAARIGADYVFDTDFQRAVGVNHELRRDQAPPSAEEQRNMDEWKTDHQGVVDTTKEDRNAEIDRENEVRNAWENR